jgi:hypothetical protein
MGSRPGPRPHLWVTGTDPELHAQRVAWARSRCQARFRGEAWDLPFEHWVEAWGDLWVNRGRGTHDVMLTRRDWHEPWSLANVEVVARSVFNRRQLERKREREQSSI